MVVTIIPVMSSAMPAWPAIPSMMTMPAVMMLHLFVINTIAAIPVAVRPAVIFHIPDIPFIHVIPAIPAFIVIIACRVAVAAAAVITYSNGKAWRSYNNERESSGTRLISEG